MMKKSLLLVLLVLVACQATEVVDDRLKIVSSPVGTLEPGNMYEFFWEVSGGAYVEKTSIQVSFSDDFETFRSSAIQTNGPGVYKGNIALESGDVYLRVHALLDGEDLYSEILSVG